MLSRKHQKLWELGTLLAVLLCANLISRAQQETSTALQTDRELRGIVVSDDGQPMAGVTVSAAPLGSMRFVSTRTAGDGSFKIGGLDQTLYRLVASAPSYVRLRRESDTSIRYYRLGESARLRLHKGAVITGTVTTSTGEAVVGVNVRAYLIRRADGEGDLEVIQQGSRTTDDRGVYRIYGLPAGTYVVAAGGSYIDALYSVSQYENDAPTYAPSSSRDTAAEFTVGAGEELTNVDIKYLGQTGHVISGLTKGDEASQFSVSLYSTSINSIMASSYPVPGSTGFVFSGIPDGIYELSASAMNSKGEIAAVSEVVAVIVKGADVTGLVLSAKPLGSITGRFTLVDAKTPECTGKRNLLFAETLVNAQRSEPTTRNTLLKNVSSATVPNNDGGFTIPNLPPGRYGVVPKLFAKYWYVQSIKLTTSAPSGRGMAGDAAGNGIDLKSGDRISGVTITVSEGAASLRGAVDSKDNSPLPSNLYLFLVPAEAESARDPLRFFAVQVDQNGRYSINNLPPGRYWALVRAVTSKEMKPLSFQLPEQAEIRAKILRQAEALKSAVELKPCQNIGDHKLTVQ